MTIRTRTHETSDKIGEVVTVYGWIHSRRDHGKVTFFDLRDRWGLLQVVVFGETIEQVKDIRPEWVVKITGTITLRPEKLINPDLISGTVELQATSIEVISKAETTPFQVDQDTLEVDEETRLTYRYLDLRSERMTRNLELRHKIISHARNYLNERGFIEVETPTLTKGTPEGAREFVVPSRLHSGSFYVLPQSPQQYKQLLMIAGIDRYYQLAHAFRDEDQRGDRQPEHTQLDIEMAFVTQEDILELMEQLFTDLVNKVTPNKRLAESPWPRITYKQAIKQYGTDKPDLRQNKNDPDELAFAFITDFPLFGKNSSGEVVAEHHPFCMPNPEDVDKLDSDPFAVRGWTYDMVCNGYELASGSIRIHDPKLQHKIFQILKLSEAEIEARFGHLLKAYNYGAPSHGGIAPGIDRLTMILANEPNIREVMAFPKTGDAREPLTGAPTPLPDRSLADAHIQLRKTDQANK
jgi:aspartyl-tRNA synthetase